MEKADSAARSRLLGGQDDGYDGEGSNGSTNATSNASSVSQPSDSMHSVGLSTVARSSSIGAGANGAHSVLVKRVVNPHGADDGSANGNGHVDNESPAVPRPSVLRTTASYIIATEFCERLAYYGFAGSRVLFFETVLNMSNADSVNSFQLW
jgi:hypothetical protein